MYIDNDDFIAWMERIMGRFDMQDKKIDKVIKGRNCLDGEELLDNQDLCLLFKVSIKTLQRYRAIGALPILHNQRKSVLQGFRCPGVHQGAVQCHHAAPVRERTQHEEKEVNLKARGRFCSGFALVYGLPNLSASSFSRSACLFNSLARSNASACFLMRYSKPFTESVRLRTKALSRSRLNFVSSKSRLLPSAFPFIRI